MGGIKIISMTTTMDDTDRVIKTRMWEPGFLASLSRAHGVILGKWLNVCNLAFTIPSPYEVVRD